MASARICLQWTLIVFNTFSIILGIVAVIAAGFELRKCLDGSASCPEKILQTLVAAVLVISTVVGCCGAVNGSIRTLCAFGIILIILIIAHSWLLWRYDETHQMVMIENLLNITWLAETVQSGPMNDIQATYECCGKENFMDYTRINANISQSCYRPRTVLNNNPYWQGCISAMKKSYLQLYRIAFWAHVGLVCFESVGVILTSILIWKLMAKTRRYHY